jgi:hypothetical protein
MLAKSTAPNHGAGRDDGWQNLRLKIKMSGGRANGGGEDEQRAERNAHRGAGRGARWGPDGGPDKVPDRSHVIGHVIFECHITRLGWQGVILLPTQLSQY